MSENIDPQRAIIIYAKHLAASYDAHIVDYKSARLSLEGSFAHILRHDAAEDLDKKIQMLEDFELIGAIHHLRTKENLAFKGAMHGVLGMASSVPLAAAFTCGAGLAAGGAVGGTIFFASVAKSGWEIALQYRLNKNFLGIISDVAEERKSLGPMPVTDIKPMGPT